MPFLQLTTNQSITPNEQQACLAELCAHLENVMGKDPKATSLSFLETPMTMDNHDEPCAHIRCYGRNFTQEATFELIPLMNKTVEAYLSMTAERISLAFSSIEETHWGWKSEPLSVLLNK